MSTPSIRELRQQYAKRQARRPSWRLVVGILVGLVGLYLVLGFFVVPPVARAQIEKRVSAQLNREVHLQKVTFNPITLAVALEGLTIRDRTGGPFLAWKRLFVDLDAGSFFSDEWHFQAIELEGFDGRVAVGKDGKANFSDLLVPKEGTPAAKDPHPRVVSIDRLSVKNAHLDYSDASQTEAFSTEIGPMTFELTHFRTVGAAGAPGEFSASNEAGEKLTWNGTVALAPLQSRGVISIEKIGLKKYSPFYDSKVRFDLLDGILDAKVPYFVSEEQGRLLVRTVGANVKLQSLKLADRQKTDKAGLVLNSVELNNISFETLTDSSSKLGVESVVVHGGQIAARRDANGLNLAAMFAPVSAPNSAPRASASTAPNTVGASGSSALAEAKVQQLSVDDLSISLDDATTPRPVHHQLEKVTLSVKNYSLSDPQTLLPLELVARLPGTGLMHVTGRVSLQPLKVDAALEFQRVALANLSPYVEPMLNARVVKGTLTSTLRAQAEVRSSATLIAVQGDVSIDDFSALDSKDDEFSSWKNLSVRQIDYTSLPAKLSIASIDWTEPTGKVIINADGSINLASLARTEAATPPTISANPNQTKESPLFILIGKFDLTNAAFNFQDQSVQPAVKVALNELSGSISGLSSSNVGRADVDLHGKFAGAAPVEISGKINPLGSQATTDLKVDFKNIDLAPLGPYVSKFAGHELQRGDLSLSLRIRLAQRKLDTANVATFQRFDLGAPTNSPDAVKLPLTLALALLRDTQGKIVIDLPVQGSLDDANFRVGRVVLRVIVNLLTKAATSPFSLIGSMFGGGKGEELAFQVFAAGQSTLTETAIAKLDVVGKALRERPGLHLEIEGGLDPIADKFSLHEVELNKRIRNETWTRSRKSDDPVLPPEQFVVSAEEESRLIQELYQDYQEYIRPKPVTPVAPSEKPTPPPKRRWFLFRVFGHSSPPPPPPSAPSSAVTPAPKPTPSSEAEMREILLTVTPVDDALLPALAAERASKVKQYLIDQGHVPPERITVMANISDKGSRVNLQLK